MATATISAATVAFIGFIVLIIWALVYRKMKIEERHARYLQLKAWHYRLSSIGLALLGLSGASAYFGLR